MSKLQKCFTPLGLCVLSVENTKDASEAQMHVYHGTWFPRTCAGRPKGATRIAIGIRFTCVVQALVAISMLPCLSFVRSCLL